MAAQLSTYGIKISQIIINNVYPDNVNCHFCRSKNLAQSVYLQEITHLFRRQDIKIIPAQPQEIKGPEMLSLVASYL